MTTGATNGFVLQSDALGNGAWVNSTALPVTENDPQVSAISINKIPKWSGTSLVDGVIFDNGTRIGIGTTSPSAMLDVRSTNTTSALFAESIGGWTIHSNSYLAGGVSIEALSDGGTAVYAETSGIGIAKLASTGDNAAGYFSGNVFMINGNVGIGTISPDVKLEVEGATGITARLSSVNSGDVNFDFKRIGSDWRIHNTTGLLFFGQSGDELTTVSDVLRLGGSSMTPAVDNFVTLGSSTLRWTQVFAVNGAINTSDARLKKNISTVNYGLDAIMQLKPVSFNWKNEITDMGKTHIGLLAQDVQKIIPEAVVDHEWKEMPDINNRVWAETENLGINYAELTPVLIKAIQEQQKMIEQLRLEIENLKRSAGL
jgi:hypothetical protein